jgi:hypothetical protein
MSCLSDYAPVYKEIADWMILSREDRSRGDYYLMQAWNVVINLTSSSPSGVQITNALFNYLATAYRWAYRVPITYAPLLVAIYAMNQYVVIKCQGNLTDFVNDTIWAGTCVPDIWEELSKEAGSDTDGWNKCNIT